MIGVVLAGGASNRFAGSPKGLIPLAGRAMALRAADILAQTCSGVMIEAPRNIGYEGLGLPLLHAPPEHAARDPLPVLRRALPPALASPLRPATCLCSHPRFMLRSSRHAARRPALTRQRRTVSNRSSRFSTPACAGRCSRRSNAMIWRVPTHTRRGGRARAGVCRCPSVRKRQHPRRPRKAGAAQFSVRIGPAKSRNGALGMRSGDRCASVSARSRSRDPAHVRMEMEISISMSRSIGTATGSRPGKAQFCMPRSWRSTQRVQGRPSIKQATLTRSGKSSVSAPN